VARFVLVHGAWHGAWCFERLSAELERRGHETWAPDLPCDQVGLTVHDYAGVVGSHPDAIVVGHSLAGLTIPFVPAAVSVFLAALVPVEETFSALDPRFQGTRRDELGRSYWPDLETTREHLYPELDEGDAARAFERLRPQAPLEPVLELPEGPRASIVTTGDRALRPEWQSRAARETLGVEPMELDAGHSPFLTHPTELADLLELLA
jgi:pimeloyl-ACP methyl ester carboxylesterase